MNNYEFLAIFEKMNRKEEKSNAIAGLLLILFMTAGAAYLLYLFNEEKKKVIVRQEADIELLKGLNNYINFAKSKFVNECNALRQDIEILKNENIALNNLNNEIQIKEANKDNA